jgi:hypothetical protein
MLLRRFTLLDEANARQHRSRRHDTDERQEGAPL